MIHPDFKFLRAIGMMIGSVIGVGIFGVPFAFSQSGYVIGLVELLLLAILVTILQFMLAELSIQTEGNHRLVGLVGKYLGQKAKWFAMIAVAGGVWGGILAYMIVGGKFLQLLLQPIVPGQSFVFTYAIVIVAGYLIFRGLKFASRLEVGVVLTLIFLFIAIILQCIPLVHFQNLSSINWSKAFLPYGVTLFALTSIGIVPEIREVLGKKARSQLGTSIIFGMMVVVILYTLFSFAVVGVTGAKTTQMALDGLIPLFGESFRFVTLLLGTITITSIFMLLGIGLMNTFRFDFGCSKIKAWFLVMVVPVVLFVSGVREFISVIGFMGVLFGGGIGIFIVRTYMKMITHPFCVEKHCLNFPKILSWLVLFVFIFGLIFEAVHLLV